MLQHAGACLRELVRSHAGDVPDTRPALRKLDTVEVVRQKRDTGTQDVAFGARPFILCGLPIRRLPEGVLRYSRRNGRFFLEVMGHPDYGVPFGQDRLIPLWIATQAVRQQSRTIEFESAGQILREWGLPQNGAHYHRGCLPEISELFKEHEIKISIRDERYTGAPIDVAFHGNLYDEQAGAVHEILKHDDGVLCAPTAFGKTVVAAKLIAARKVSTLVLLHRQQLLDQWRQRLAMFLDVPVKSIGQIAGGKVVRTGFIDVALLQSLHRKGEVKDFVAEYGHIIIDECHHISAFSFEQVMRQVKARYVTGLTATPTRKDGHHPIIFMQCGPTRFSMSARDATARSPFRHLVRPRHTGFRTASAEVDFTIHDAYRAIINDPDRNRKIVADVLDAVHKGRTPLVLTHRTGHVDRLAAEFSSIEHVLVLKGGMGKKQRQAIAERLASIPEGVPRIIVATGSYIGEGFDDPRLDTLFLTTPISWTGTLQQYVGRLHRLHEGKKVVEVYDYVDSEIPMLARMFEKRLKGYRTIGYELANECATAAAGFGDFE